MMSYKLRVNFDLAPKISKRRGVTACSRQPTTREQERHKRRLAVDQLLRVEQGAYASLIGGSPTEPHGDASAARDRRQVTLMVAGVTRMRLKLDYILQQYMKLSMKRLDRTATLQALRLGLYELTEMGKPSHVINEHVEIAKTEGKAKLVNAILRNIVRSLDQGTLPGTSVDMEASDEEWEAAASIMHSHPVWMIKRWRSALGREATLQLLQHNNNPPCQGIRVLAPFDTEGIMNALRDEVVVTELSTFLPEHFLRIQSGLQTALTASFSHRYVVQDEAAGMVVATVLRPEPGDHILDCCAAPGGKLFFAGQLMDNTGSLVALEPQEARCRRMKSAAQKHKLDFIEFHQSSLQQFVQEIGSAALFDRVLLDVPCSGTGVMSKKADLRWKRSEANLPNLISLQDELLDKASQLVKPGGLLVYSTCSLEPEENADRVKAFLSSHEGWQQEPVLDEAAIEHGLITEEGSFQSWPHLHHIDGAFAARLRSIA